MYIMYCLLAHDAENLMWQRCTQRFFVYHPHEGMYISSVYIFYTNNKNLFFSHTTCRLFYGFLLWIVSSANQFSFKDSKKKKKFFFLIHLPYFFFFANFYGFFNIDYILVHAYIRIMYFLCLLSKNLRKINSGLKIRHAEARFFFQLIKKEQSFR